MSTIRGLASRLYVAGEWRDQGSAGFHEHRSRATDTVMGEVPLGGATEVEEAIEAADAALAQWAGMGPKGRRDCLFRLAQLVDERSEQFESAGRLDTGIPRKGWHWRHQQAVDWIRVYAGYADKVEGGVTASTLDGTLEYQLLEPYGVVGVIITWNAPLISLAMKVPAALAAGNTVVVKPSELNPFTPTLFAQACEDAGIPAGVVSIVNGAAEAGTTLTRHPKVRKISFTGGGRTAAAIIRDTADQAKPLCMELGGKSPYLIFPDADMDLATARPVADLGNAGQSCRFGSRLLVHRAVADEFRERVVPRIAALRVGDPDADDTDMGPLISREAQKRVLGILDGVRAGSDAEILCGGGVPALPGELADGYFVEPTFLETTNPAATTMQQEIFGPVFTMTTFETEEEAVALANDTAYGLGAFIHTQDLRTAHRVAAQVRAGTIYVNAADRRNGNAPFGGYGASGYGREGGRAGLLEFVQTKTIGIA